ncbi:MAG TPA: hypothetical protein VK737_05385 [Opitutales bacterium]|jgi:hypothetical protein|nr:hypothetical protein [Opitutales bacterium]
MSTPSENPSPTPMSPLSGAPAASAPKPAFKVTRSPFAPKITGAVPAAGAAAGTSGGPMAIGASSALGDAPVPGLTRKVVSAQAQRSDEVGPALLVVDFLAGGVAVAAAVMIALQYFKQ